MKNPLHRSSINEFRPGNHRLRIETGRYTAPKTPEDLRICSICQPNEVENECHITCFLALCIIRFAAIFLMKPLTNVTFLTI